MSELEKQKRNELYNANYDKNIQSNLYKCKDLCNKYNKIKPSNINKRKNILNKIFKEKYNIMDIQPPFYCDFGFNIKLGKNFYANHNFVVLDGAKVIIGDDVFIGPNCIFTTAGHPIDHKRRNEGLEYAHPITIGNNVWFGANVLVMPGITIGSNVVIGAGSVVTKNIEDNTVAVGNPCKPIRKITAEDELNQYKFNK